MADMTLGDNSSTPSDMLGERNELEADVAGSQALVDQQPTVSMVDSTDSVDDGVSQLDKNRTRRPAGVQSSSTSDDDGATSSRDEDLYDPVEGTIEPGHPNFTSPLSSPNGHREGQEQTLDSDSDNDVGSGQNSDFDLDEPMGDDGQYADVLDSLSSNVQDVPQDDVTVPDTQEQESATEDTQVSEKRLSVAVDLASEQREHTPSSQLLANETNEESASLFVPYERAPSKTPDRPFETFARPYTLNRASATPDPFTQTPSKKTRPPVQPALKFPSPFLSKIVNLQRKHQQDKLAARVPTPRAEIAPDSENYLEAILSRGSARQASVEGHVIDNEEKADREAVAKFHRHKECYESKERMNGKLTFVDAVNWTKIKSAEQKRLQKKKRDLEVARQESGESELFSDSFGLDDSLPDNEQDVEMFDNDSVGSARRSMPSMSRNFPSMAEAEVQSMEVALEAARDDPRSKRKGPRTPKEAHETSSGRGRSHTKGAKSRSSGQTTGSRAKGGIRKTAKDKKERERAIRMKTSLMHSDVILQQAAEDAPEQPTFTARRKEEALKELIASVPIEHQKTAKDDQVALLRATRDFDGRGSCKADGHGMWKVKGMGTSLKHYQVLGTAFMRRRENDPNEPRGGLMADQMGLGKTLMSKLCSRTLYHINPCTDPYIRSVGEHSQWSWEL